MLKENTIIKIQTNIEKASQNFQKISNNIKNQKFIHLDEWLYKKSKTFSKENVEKNITTYPRFEYGTILKVDFGINDGSEISGPHFAISLNKYDSTKNPIITVLPLTSQNKKHNLPLNELIIDAFTKRLKKNLDMLCDKKEQINIKNFNKDKEIKLLQEMLDYYSNYAKKSYACINLISTISKNKIIKPKNKFDIIGRSKCNNKTMQIISNEIIKKYTNFQFSKNELMI